MNRKIIKNKKMSLKQLIQDCEDNINRLEQMKMIRYNGDQISDNQLSLINKDIEESYQQMAILKIRRMMGY